MGINFAKLPPSPLATVGVGGPTQDLVADAVVLFSDDSDLYAYRIRLAVADPEHQVLDLPSLLGRDILDRWLVRYEPSNGVLDATVASVDAVFPIATSGGPITPERLRE